MSAKTPDTGPDFDDHEQNVAGDILWHVVFFLGSLVCSFIVRHMMDLPGRSDAEQTAAAVIIFAALAFAFWQMIEIIQLAKLLGEEEPH